jgi:SNF2 family DNA or RNA helicase
VYAPLRLKMPASCRAMEQKLKEELEVELRSGTTLYALSQTKLGQLIRQFASGAVYTNEQRTEWEEVHTEKLKALRDRVDESQGEPVLVFAWFRHSKERILRDFKGAEVLTGKPAQVERWNRREIPVLVANPQGSGMGLNLQRGSAEAFWFDPEWSREKLDQGNGRLARLGQPEPYVTSTIALIGDLDARIWRRLQEKGADEESLIESVALPEF